MIQREGWMSVHCSSSVAALSKTKKQYHNKQKTLEREREKQRKLGSKDRGPSPVHSAIVLQTLISESPPTLGGAEMKEERDQGTPARKDRGPSPVDSLHVTCYLPSFSTLSSVGSLHFLCVSSMSSLVILASVVTAACIHLTASVRTHWL